MSNLQKILTSQFGVLTVDVVRTPDSQEPGVTREQLGVMLGYKNPSDAIAIIHRRKKERLDKFATYFKMKGEGGKQRDICVYGFKGVLEICRYSEQPLADSVIDWAWETLDKLRRGELSPPSQVEAPTPQSILIDGISYEIPVGFPFSMSRSKTGLVTIRFKKQPATKSVHETRTFSMPPVGVQEIFGWINNGFPKK